jgi:5-methyltetrahydropteroyltriglutamate--homocysteine methyltransferase
VADLESVDFLRARIDDAGRFINVSQLGLSPQCGFASTVAGNPVTESDQLAKLARCVEVAKKVWGD